ncbi:BQ2448_1755 [Microbotryum intermedium]|uniref:Glutamyl-tRNA(Gln) amidotransferase subunit B, mitochondrial n=1 Tax=Microbotryum intermedium TaxID=269621 RepID=A0A238FE30_9BASI|nr:BQ2448_1755 [Microbotryum intermedium]
MATRVAAPVRLLRTSNMLSNCICHYLSSSVTAHHTLSLYLSSSASSCAKGKGKASVAQEQRWAGWQPVIGLELHVQLKGNPKLFSSASARYDAEPNTQIQPFDAALPGSLPVRSHPFYAIPGQLVQGAHSHRVRSQTLSSEPVRLALLACLALDSSINPASAFDRKHYFYPDLPAGFQVTQNYAPLAKGGTVKIRKDTASGVMRDLEVRIDQIQLEQDTAKLFHDPYDHITFVDLNRAGAALIEIVTKPDMRSPEEAASFVRSLQSILRHVGASDANMDRGELRCDVNVSVRPVGGLDGTRCEIKNLNGVRFLVGAIESEISRQIESINAGLPVVQSTMGYDAVDNRTFVLRSKEDVPDYRYMPDPELGPVVVTKVSPTGHFPVFLPSADVRYLTPYQTTLDHLRSTLPELPIRAFERLQTQYGLSPRDVGILVAVGESLIVESSSTTFFPEWLGGSEVGLSVGTASIGTRYFETLAFGRQAQVCANWVIHDLLSALGSTTPPINFLNSPIGPHELGQLIDALGNGKITSTNAKTLLKDYIANHPVSSSNTPSPESWTQVLEKAIEAHQSLTNEISLEEICRTVIQDLVHESVKVRKGNPKVLMRLVGQVMKVSKGMADAQEAKKMLEKMLLPHKK